MTIGKEKRYSKADGSKLSQHKKSKTQIGVDVENRKTKVAQKKPCI